MNIKDVGDDVETILTRLLQAADGDVSKAERGIVFIDEIDKKSKKNEGTNITRDVSGEGVQQALLKIIEGSECRVSMQGNRKHPNAEMITINTKNVLFIVGGAFVGLTDIISKRLNTNENSIGFGAFIETDHHKKSTSELLTHIETVDFVKYGLIPELVGRLPVIVYLEDLSEEQLIKILKEPKNAIVKQYIKLFRLEQIELEFEYDALVAIAKLAIIRKTGARGLRGVLEKRLMPIQFSLADYREQGIKKIIITKEFIDGSGTPVLFTDSILEEAI